MRHYGIAGAGLTGSVIGRVLAEAGHKVTIYDERNHVAGNCHTERRHGIMVHAYGPHIFHTDNAQVWAYVNRFATMRDVKLKVIAQVGAQHYSFPINLLTMCQVYKKSLTPDEARAMIVDKTIADPQNFEQAAIKSVGKTLYCKFFKGYTQKQWGRRPSTLPASIFKRLPVRFTHDDNYFYHRWQGVPEEGYTAMVERILDHPNITLHLSTSFDRLRQYDHVVWTGTIDSFFDYEAGALAYRTLTFEHHITDGDYQGCHQVNFCDAQIPYTRRVEHKHFAPWELHDNTIVTSEISSEWQVGDIPYYPIRLAEDQQMLKEYMRLAHSVPNVTFAGRLGTYRYMDMDVTIAEALKTAQQINQ
jgi:UDP-galactopyranose mutase